MRARTVVFFVVVGLGLLFFGAALSQALDGPIVAANKAGLGDRARAMAVSHFVRSSTSAVALPRAVLSTVYKDADRERARFQIDDHSGARVLECAWQGSEQAARDYVDYIGGEAPLRRRCSVFDSTGFTIYELNARLDPPCPGQFTNLSQHQIQNGLFRPAVDPKRSAVLKTPDPRGSASVEGEPLRINSFVSRGQETIYCGEIEEGAGFHHAGGWSAVRDADIAASAYYYRALASANQASDATHRACGYRPTSLYLYSLVSEVVTEDTVEDFAKNFALGDELVALLKGHDHQRVCFVLPDLIPAAPEKSEDSTLARRTEKLIWNILSFPVFAPFDARETSRASPLMAQLYRAVNTSDPEQLSRKFPALTVDELSRMINERSSRRGCDRACRIHRGLQTALRGLAEPNRNDDGPRLAASIAGSGDYQLSDTHPFGYVLEASSSARAGSRGGALSVQYASIWPKEVDQRAKECAQNGSTCVFRGIWSHAQIPAGVLPAEDHHDFRSFIGLFARRNTNAQCARTALSRIALAPPSELRTVQTAITDLLYRPGVEPPSSGRQSEARLLGLLPDSVVQVDGRHELRMEPFLCPEELTIAYVEDEPWRGVVDQLRLILEQYVPPVRVKILPVKAEAVRRGGTTADWDLLLTAATYYTSADLPTLSSIIVSGAANNYSLGEPLSAEGNQDWEAYESSVVRPRPPWLAARGREGSDRGESRATLLTRLERSVYDGPAPIYVMGFFDPLSFRIAGASNQVSFDDPYLFARAAGAR